MHLDAIFPTFWKLYFQLYNGIDVNLGADESLLCVLQMTVFYYNISDVSVWSFVVAINKNCKRVSKNNHDLCNISEDLYIISVGDSLHPCCLLTVSVISWSNGLPLFTKFLKGGLFSWMINKGNKINCNWFGNRASRKY